MGVGMLAGGVLAFAGAGHVSAAPPTDLPSAVDGLAGIVTALPQSALVNSSAELGLPDILGELGKQVLPQSGTAGSTSRCTSVIQIGDSTSVLADDTSAVPATTDTASAQYRRVGATNFTLDAKSGRAIVDGPAPAAQQAVAAQLAAGKRGCWVIAMGVNDAGAISTGSSVSAAQRIDAIMSQLQGQPVLWPTIATSNPENQAFDAAAMATVNNALRAATTRYPNLAVVDWAAVAQPNEFTDGIHYTAAGTADRNKRFADALVVAYPAGAGSTPATRWVTPR